MNIHFLSFKESDFPLMLQWLESLHVKQWWDQDIVYTMDLIKEKFGQHMHGIAISNDLRKITYAYIITVDDKKIGYIQAYNARMYADENGLDLSFIQEALCGVDLFIGDKQYLHKGLGPIILEEFADQILSTHFDYCLIDPSSSNKSAIRAFEKAGFKVANQLETKETSWMIKEIKRQAVVFTQEIDSNFDEKMSTALRLECQSLSPTPLSFEEISIYAKQDNQTLAGIKAYMHGAIVWLDAIYVIDEFKNQEIGSKLVSKLIEMAKKNGAREIQLNTYFPKAQKFFKHCGFNVVSIIPNWKYDLTCYFMKRELPYDH